MKRIMLAVAVVACVPAPVSLVANVAPSTDLAACATSKLTAMGYVVESGNRELGLVKATKRTDNFVTTMNVAPFDETGVKKVRITTDLVNYDNPQQPQSLGSTKYTRADAQAVLDACGTR